MCSTFTREISDGFKIWKGVQKSILLKSSKQLLRLDCLNPITAIKYPSKRVLSTNISGNIDELWQNFTKTEYRHNVVTLGVRESLDGLFRLINKLNYRLIIPSDVYPVYNQIAAKHGIFPYMYTSVDKSINNIFHSFTNSSDLQCNQEELHESMDSGKLCMLLTAPHVPTGQSLSDNDVKSIINWLDGDPDRLVIIDAVYAYDPLIYRDQFHKLFMTNKVIICSSLSKSFLLPLHYGVIYLPQELSYFATLLNCVKPNTDLLNKASTVLVSNPDLPKYQSDFFKSKWDKLKPLLKSIQPNWTTPENGYLSTLPINFEKLHKDYNILAVPSYVYSQEKLYEALDKGTNFSPDYSIISCLYDNDSERKKYYVTRMSNFSRAFDKYSRTYNKDLISESTFKDKFFLLSKDNLGIGFRKVCESIKGSTKVDDDLLVLETDVPCEQVLYNSENGKGQYIKSSKIHIANVYEINNYLNLNKMDVESAYALSMKINNVNLVPYTDLAPRTVSILPIAKGCQAKCAFCFSHSSISSDQKQQKLPLSLIERMLVESKRRGAERAVITGGGEPTMLPTDKLNEMIRLCSKYYDKVVLITNGYSLGKSPDNLRLQMLLDMQKNGLSVLSISRHGISNENNKQIMYLDTMSDKVADTFRENSTLFPKLQLRWVCVLQKGGVHNEDTLAKYLDWTVGTGVDQICFKELYVATSHESVYYNDKTNIWSRENQVSLSLLINFIEKNGGKVINKLPWDSPIYEINWKGKKMIVAAYTEPSVHWERSTGICRSWNIMADGQCFASLEDRSSLISL